MIIKDFNVEFSDVLVGKYLSNKQEKDIIDTVVFASCEVVIKREGKNYLVPLVRRIQLRKEIFTVQAYNDFIQHFINDIKQIDNYWIVSGAQYDMQDGKKLFEKEFPQFEE